MSTMLTRAAERLAGSDGPAVTDERGRDVILRAHTLAVVLTLVLDCPAAAVLATVGFDLWSSEPTARAGILGPLIVIIPASF